MVYDLETTGLRPEQDEIIEIGAVRWVDGAIGDTFHSFVRPTRRVPDEIYELTGLTPADLQNAPPLETVLPQFLKFISGSTLAGHNAQFDLNFLMAACDKAGYELPASRDVLDSLLLARVLLPFEQAHRLGDVAARCGVEQPGEHRGLADALTTAKVLSALMTEASALPYLTLQQLERLASLFSPITANWFGMVAERRYQTYGTALPAHCDQIQQLVFAAVPPHPGETDAETAADMDGETPGLCADTSAAREDGHSSDSELPGADGEELVVDPSTFFTADSPLGQALPSFEIRPGQRAMVDAVTTALEEGRHLIAEAGTGTGKSLAYLIPAALHAAREDARVIVSTHTIALQDQIEQRDFATLRRVMNMPLSLAVFKGRTHYLCMRKLAQENAGADFGTPRPELEAYMTLLSWVANTPAGNREELSMSGRLADVWQRVQSETETCIHKRCPFFKSCYYFRARSAAYEADIVVTNHSLVLSDLKSEHRVLPHYDKIIFDEAHHLEEEATRHLGAEVYAGQCAASVGRLVRDGGKHGVIAELLNRLSDASTAEAVQIAKLETLQDGVLTVKAAMDDAFAALAQLVPAGQSEFRITPDVTRTPAWQAYQDAVHRMTDLQTKLRQLAEDLDEAAERTADQDIAGRLYDCAGFVRDVAAKADTLCRGGDAGPDFVVWIERTGTAERPHWSLHIAPIDVAGILRSTLFETKASVVLTSATLSVNGNFDFISERLGLSAAAEEGRLQTLSVPSPFDYKTQAMLCVPTDVPELAKMGAEEAAVWLSDSIYQLAKASGGRLLALFTSHAMLRATARTLRDPLRSLNIRLFAQGVDGTRSHLLEPFRKNPNAVLLGAQSFWEGIDLPGDQLTTLVIIRLPFAPPTHPVTAARHERLEQQGKSAFWHASLPEAVVRFRQGFGRLIRTMSDRGVVVIYDKRIITAKYGQTFIRSLPGLRPLIAPEAQVIEQVRRFLTRPNKASESAHTSGKEVSNERHG
ncbi:helicase C-terminal domain-containing protein [Alicyclobacillus cycloheptanicus]|uniref:helicase C-terminal domain-containing protein n=1 Tax=Alicyclobacillus cycloheptanicus TaxID=1457 RepID=UPI002379D5F2|nr:helicase C-terminal domain-containing protein [Alicyclobacillus cycloheptanicus]